MSEKISEYKGDRERKKEKREAEKETKREIYRHPCRTYTTCRTSLKPPELPFRQQSFPSVVYGILTTPRIMLA